MRCLSPEDIRRSAMHVQCWTNLAKLEASIASGLAGSVNTTRMKNRPVSASSNWLATTISPPCRLDDRREARDDAGPVGTGQDDESVYFHRNREPCS
jgi:hypothetical protein